MSAKSSKVSAEEFEIRIGDEVDSSGKYGNLMKTKTILQFVGSYYCMLNIK